MHARLSIIALIALCALMGGARADAIEDFYKGKTVNVVIGNTAGGTYDLYGRTIARHLTRFIPGNPRTIFQNMPGAASYQAAAHVMNIAPQDGTYIAGISAALPYQPLVDPNAPKLDVPRIQWLHSPSTFIVTTIVRSDFPVKTWEDLRVKETVMATIAPGQLPSLIVAAANDTLGLKIRGINGHPGLNDAMLALERGEIDGYPAVPVDALKRLYAEPMKAGKIRVLLQYGPSASPDHPEAPYAVDLIKDPEDRAVMELAQAPLKGGYLYHMGPNVPKQRVEAMRDAFARLFKDPEFIADCERQTLNVEPVFADRIAELTAAAYRSSPRVVERIRELYRR
jgi:tripartite-type tricarboxylate transporter receptor subunit TctC